MPRRLERRFDFRGGVNLAYSSDALDRTEVRSARNAAQTQYGALRTRPGTQRVHDTAIGGGAAVLGLHQWHPTAGRQLVGIAGGNLYHKLQSASDFTEVLAAFSATVRPSFVSHSIGGTPTLYIADGTLRKWDGTSVSDVTGAPSATRVRIYKNRLFALDDTKTLHWARIGNPEDWSVDFAGSAPVGMFDAEALLAHEVIGSSLLLFKGNSVARFTGVSGENIRIDQETEGISPDVGAIAPGTVIRVEEFVFFLTDRGPYAATESGVQALGPKIEPAFDEAEMDHLPNAVAVHHKARREIWIFFPENTETTNTVGYCFNYRVGSWTGPWDFGGTFDVCSVAQVERDDRSESVMLGGYDGFVREGAVDDVGALDDVLRVGTGGTAVTYEVTFPDLLFGSSGHVKRLNETQYLNADLGAAGAVTVAMSGDGLTAESTAIASTGAGVKPYDFRPGTEGRRITLSISATTSTIVELNGLELVGDLTTRQI